MKSHAAMTERLEAARKKLAELEKIAEPDDATLGSIRYLKGIIRHLEIMLDPQK
jgi:hypothetical protein